MANCKECVDCDPYYFITYKYIRTAENIEIGEGYYNIPLEIIKQQATEIKRIAFEHDSRKRLHMHVICQMKKRPSMRAMALKGYSVNIKYVFDEDKLNQYLNKEIDGKIDSTKKLKTYLFDDQ